MPFEIILSGRVQGVGCRWYCARVGQTLGTHGAVTNLDDGNVQVLLETEDDTEARAYLSALERNSFSLHFYGRIESSILHSFSGRVEGDYCW